MKLQSKILAILCAIAIFIPSLVAIISYNNTNKAPVSDKNVRVITIADLAGAEFSFEKGKSDADNQVIELPQQSRSAHCRILCRVRLSSR